MVGDRRESAVLAIELTDDRVASIVHEGLFVPQVGVDEELGCEEVVEAREAWRLIRSVVSSRLTCTT